MLAHAGCLVVNRPQQVGLVDRSQSRQRPQRMQPAQRLLALVQERRSGAVADRSCRWQSNRWAVSRHQLFGLANCDEFRRRGLGQARRPRAV